ncbi:MAG: triose-phosphate isomerase [Malacoplasma sp.]|nr:triose-phosphate isomerase [Malacoplasma sp.]
MREKILIANWKMNADYISITKFFKNIGAIENVKLLVAPSYLGIIPSLSLVGDKNIEVIAQNVSLPTLGNHTGSISWVELKDYGIKTTLLGHPDVKVDFKEKNYQINAKLHKLVKNNLKAVVFIEETMLDLSKENTKENLKLQIDQIFADLESIELIDKVYIVYKPNFIGDLGNRFDLKFVFDTIKIIREFLRNKFGYYVGNNLPILYGGEIVNDEVEAICTNYDLDGILIENESALSSKYITILYKHLYNGSGIAYEQYYEHKVLIDLPTEEERIKNVNKPIDFDIYDVTSDTYFEDIKIVEEDF